MVPAATVVWRFVLFSFSANDRHIHATVNSQFIFAVRRRCQSTASFLSSPISISPSLRFISAASWRSDYFLFVHISLDAVHQDLLRCFSDFKNRDAWRDYIFPCYRALCKHSKWTHVHFACSWLMAERVQRLPFGIHLSNENQKQYFSGQDWVSGFILLYHEKMRLSLTMLNVGNVPSNSETTANTKKLFEFQYGVWVWGWMLCTNE